HPARARSARRAVPRSRARRTPPPARSRARAATSAEQSCERPPRETDLSSPRQAPPERGAAQARRPCRPARSVAWDAFPMLRRGLLLSFLLAGQALAGDTEELPQGLPAPSGDQRRAVLQLMR